MRPHPVSLTDTQLDLMLDAAERIPEEWRWRFISLVADNLMREDVISDQDVELAIALVLTRMEITRRGTMSTEFPSNGGTA